MRSANRQTWNVGGLQLARRRVAMAQLIGWKALEDSWQKTVDEIVAAGGEADLARLRETQSRTGKRNAMTNAFFARSNV